MQPSLYTPAPGSAAPGNLYADLQSRTLWLGVDPAVDPNQAVLISDILSLQSQITTGDAAERAYTDAQIQTRAPTSHTHTSAQITDFTAAVTSIASAIPSLQYVKGMILMYSGSLANIGVGSLVGWALCDGGGVPARPDLRDKFVLGAGNKVPGLVNPSALADTNTTGAHVHTINGTVISDAQMPSHNHGGITGYMSHDHAHNVSLNTGTESADHSHPVAEPSGWCVKGESWSLMPVGNGGRAYSGGRSAAHYHYVSGGTSGVTQNHYHSIPNAGSDASHTHTEVTNGSHAHTVTSAELRDAIPYYTLAFIIKL
jgi:hypothetical protein